MSDEEETFNYDFNETEDVPSDGVLPEPGMYIVQCTKCTSHDKQGVKRTTNDGVPRWLLELTVLCNEEGGKDFNGVKVWDGVMLSEDTEKKKRLKLVLRAFGLIGDDGKSVGLKPERFEGKIVLANLEQSTHGGKVRCQPSYRGYTKFEGKLPTDVSKFEASASAGEGSGGGGDEDVPF